LKASTIFSIKLLKIGIFVLLICSSLTVCCQSVLLPNGFAHNDYRHRHPLFDALGNGYTNFEADIFSVKNNLIVAHIDPFFKSGRTLENLYLRPLYQRVTCNGGEVYKGYNKPVILMIDIKTGAQKTYKALMPLLEKYRPMLSSYDHGTITPGAVTVVLSGHKPYKMIKGEESRLAFIDEDLRKAASDTVADVYTMASCKYSKLVKWTGIGNMPDNQQKRLCAYVAAAHKYGEKVRLWASPENYAVWQELLKCGVDLINTDKLVTLKDFLVYSHKTYANLGSVKPQSKSID
jgi:hypothetical protein